MYLILICLYFTKQKLIEYNHLEPGDPGLDGGKNAQLFTNVLNMICSCVNETSPDRYILYLTLDVDTSCFLFAIYWM